MREQAGKYGPIIPDIAESALAHSLSGPLTTVWFIRKYCPELLRKTSLCIHIIGVSPEDLTLIGRGWEEVMHCLPNLKQLDIYHFGIQLQQINKESLAIAPIAPTKDSTCWHCKRAGRKRQEIICADHWHLLRHRAPAPDLFVALNVGFEDSCNEGLSQTLLELPRHPAFLFTCLSEPTLARDCVYLMQRNFQLAAHGASPFRSPLARSNTHQVEGYDYENARYAYATRP
jgi:hypothetical protein